MDVNYKKVKRYKTAKYPIRQPWYLMLLIWVLSKLALMGKKFKIEKINMKGLKPPYMILSTHNHFIDFELTALGTFPHRVNNVVNIDGYYQRPWLMEWIGAICTRKFTNDMHLIRSIKKVLMRGDILCMYPEARYSPCGTDSFLPDSLGRLVKMCKVPVVAVVHRGNHLYAPFWNFRKKRKVSLHTTIKQILTADDIASLSPDEIMEILKRSLNTTITSIRKTTTLRLRKNSVRRVFTRRFTSAPIARQNQKWRLKVLRSSVQNAENAGRLMKTEHSLQTTAKQSSPMFPIGLNGNVSRSMHR